MTENQKIYLDFRSAENDLYHEVIQKSETLLSCPKKPITFLKKMPCFIRWIGYPKSHNERKEILESLENLKEKYFLSYLANRELYPTDYKDNLERNVEKKEDMIYPQNFLQYLPEAKSVTLSIYDAWRSLGVIKKDEIYSRFISADIFDFEKISINDIRCLYPSFTANFTGTFVTVSVLGEDIYRVAEKISPLNGKELIWREKSGSKYTANVSNGNGVIKKTSFNFLLINSDCFFSLCTPRKTRDDRLIDTTNFYNLPFAQYLGISKRFVFAK